MSFLQAASAKIITNKLLNKQQADTASFGGGLDIHTLSETLRLLLVEEECGARNCDGNDNNLAQSLAMDFAYSLVKSSPFGCRGCNKYSGNSSNGTDLPVGCLATDIPSRAACKCCKVALLIPGEPRTTKKKRRRSESRSNRRVLSRNRNFPMCFLRYGVDGDERWDPTLLGQIQIKYVTSLAEVIQYLAYATSLPDQLLPLDGIVLLGMGELLPRQNINMELTHLLSMLSDTADALEEKGRSLMEMTSILSKAKRHRRCSIVATIEKSAHSLIHQNVVRYLHHWIDFISIISPLKDDTPPDQEDTAANCSEWELVYKNTPMLEKFSGASVTPTEQDISLKFRVTMLGNKSGEDHFGPLREISWK